MSCPKCGESRPHMLWDDNLWWGCKNCGFAENLENAIFFYNPVRRHPEEDNLNHDQRAFDE